MKPVFAIWMYWGAELRAFVYSGVARELARRGDLYLVSRVDPRELAPHSLPEGGHILPLSPLRYSRGFSRLHSFANLVHGEWVAHRFARAAIRDKAAIGDTDETGPKRVRRRVGRVFACPPVVRLLNWLVLGWGRRMARSSGPVRTEIPWSRKGVLLTGDYLSVPGHLFAQSARAAGWRVCFYPLNWRDISKGARIALPVTDLAVWDAPMKDLLFRNNPWLRKLPCRVVGSTQFDSHFREDWVLDRSAFCRTLAIDPDRRIVCYSGVSERAYRGEAAILDLLAREIRAAGWENRLQILVRLNPTASDPAYRDVAARWNPLVKLIEPEWDTRFTDGTQPVWRSNTESDARLMANLIRHSDVQVCIPSTTVVDFGTRGVPSVCIAFDPPDGLTRHIRAADFARQELFQGAFDTEAVFLARSAPEAANAIGRFLENRGESGDCLSRFVTGMVGPEPGTAHLALAECVAACAAPGQMPDSTSRSG